ncbi:hypothetical protein ACR6A7_08270 [Pantoea sp. RRHST58]|uniref:hypothetical protein n=1 Tax=Pantoea sp. RRHST58 TaxID=3425183 RepID=UPI003DA19132
MELLNKSQLVNVAGANGGGNYESFNNPNNYTGHTRYGGQGGGFVGTNSAGLDLGSLIDANKCVISIATGIFAGSSNWASAIKGGLAGAITGGCFSNGNGNGGGSGSNNIGGQCTW